ncbi:MAG: hypothetical protein V2A73_19505, partial [Pseudomonadota bacterium]
EHGSGRTPAIEVVGMRRAKRATAIVGNHSTLGSRRLYPCSMLTLVEMLLESQENPSMVFGTGQERAQQSAGAVPAFTGRKVFQARAKAEEIVRQWLG